MSESVLLGKAGGTAVTWAWLPGLGLIVLGGTVLIGWFSHQALLVGLLPGFPPMVMSTALMFIASGLALAALAKDRPQLAQLAGSGIGILALGILAEHFFDVELGIDLASAHSWAQDGFPYPGRAARATALCFALAAAALVLFGTPAQAWRLWMAGLLGVAISLISIAAVTGNFLGLDALYPAYALRGMAIPTAAGLTLLGAALYHEAQRRWLADQLQGLDRRIVSIGSLLLAGVALLTGLPIAYLVKSHIQDTLVAGLRTGVDAEVQLIGTILSLREQRGAIVNNRPDIVEGLRALTLDATDAVARNQLQAALESFEPHGFSALRASLPDGRILAARGDFVAEPQLSVPLDATSGQTLLWDGSFYLRSHFEVRGANQVLGRVEIEQPLPQMVAAIASAQSLGVTGELQLCKKMGAVVRCFPNSRRLQPLELPYSNARDAPLLMHAAAGGTGVHFNHDVRGQQVIGVIAPVAQQGLFVVLKMDAAELYAPLRADLEITLLLTVFMVAAGSLLFRRMVRPLAADLVHARESSQDQTRAVERLHAFQRAVFEQAPDGILVADSEGRIVEANERMAVLFGYSREMLTSKRIEDLVPDQVRAQHHRHRASFQQAPTTRAMSRDRTLQGQRQDGSQFPIEVALAPMHTAEGKRVIAIVKDVSEARQVEQTVRDALKEKDLLLGEIHHRVKNNLQIVQSLLDMQAGLTTDERAASALRDSQGRIQSMALIHQTLYQSHDFGKVEFADFLRSLMTHLQNSYGRSEIRMDTTAEAVRLGIDRAIPCGLIVNELITNALKHGFPAGRSGSVQVELQLLRGNDIKVAVSDDGVGIPDTLDLDNLPSLGFQLIGVLTEQLHAQVQIQRSGPTRVAFIFPLE